MSNLFLEARTNLDVMPNEVWKKLLVLVSPIFFCRFNFRKRLKIKDIPAIWNPAGSSLRTKKDYERLIDLPVRKAVMHLNNLGIRTDYSSGNIEDAEAGSGAVIRFHDYDLSNVNLKIAKLRIIKC